MTLPKDVARLLEDERRRNELPDTELDDAWRALVPRIVETPRGMWSGSRRLWTTVGVAAIAFGAGLATGRVVERRATPSLPVDARDGVEAAEHPPSANEQRSVQTAKSDSPDDERKNLHATTGGPAPDGAGSMHVAASASAGSLRLEGQSQAGRAGAIHGPLDGGLRGPPSGLADERALVEGARTALLRGRPSDALVLAEKHEALFPSGELAEERDFVLASALQAEGRNDEARAKARAFLARYPASALRESAEAISEGR